MSRSILNTELSLYENITSFSNTTYTLEDILHIIKKETLLEEIEQLRAEKEKTTKDALKKTLPAITVSGVFNGRRVKNNIIRHTGLMQVDLDHLAKKDLLKTQLMKDQFTLAVFESPGGEGLKVIIKILANKITHEEYFLQVENYYLFKYKIQIDKSCKDVTRLMFLSSDKNIYINENSKEFDLNILTKDELTFSKAVKNINIKNEFKEGNRNTFVFKLACECKKIGMDEKTCFKYSKEYYCENSFSENEIYNIIKSAYKKTEITPKNSKTEILNDFKWEKGKESLLKIRSAQKTIDDAKNQPIPKMLFSEFWYEGEICILFADTNVGKSILAVQIANSISKGEVINNFKLEGEKQKVYYADFELGDKQFQNRYSQNYESNYVFDDNFYRININPEFTDFKDFDELLFIELERNIVEQGIKVLIIDNITYLRTQSTEAAKDALLLMRKLKELQMKYSLSLLILAHTPKRDFSKPITINDLAGSRQLANFVDSIFSIGTSFKETAHRYMKQLKARSTEIIYGGQNVITCRIDKPHNFLAFYFLAYGDEGEHLKQYSEIDKTQLENQILNLKENDPSLSLRDLAGKLNTNHMTVKRILEKANL